MIYFDSSGVALMGKEGFIGKALSRKKLDPGVYFFDSPSSNILFDEELDYCMEETIFNFLKVVQYCRDNDKYLIFPSSATIYNKNTSYARCKAILEEIVQSYDIKYLGLRIAAGYGPSESHKGRYASVIYQWCKQMLNDERPVIFGDGTQTRDFVYEDDIATAITKLTWEDATGFYDIGTGINTTFNGVVATINEVLGTKIKPIYVDKPKNYVPETNVKYADGCDTLLINGIEKIIDSL